MSGKKQRWVRILSKCYRDHSVLLTEADDISAEVYNFKEANEVLENQVENCDVEKVKTEPELMNTKMVKKCTMLN